MAKHLLDLSDSNFSATLEQSEVPLMVDFWAPWCGPCRLVAPIVEELAESYSGRLQVGKLNTDESPSVAAQYNIRSIPTLLFFKKGQVVGTVIGAVPKDKLKQKVEEVLGN